MKNFKVYYLVFILLIVSVSSLARNMCYNLFETEAGKTFTRGSLASKTREDEKDQLIDRVAKNLKSVNSKFSIQGRNLYFDFGDGKKNKAAKVQILYPEYVFEYQDKSFHEYWLKNGVTKEDMNLIIESPGQFHGRGYYVSLSATDSYSFGNYLTVFKMTKPLILLELNYDDFAIKRLITEDPATIRQLVKAGVTGIRGTNTWLSIFDESYLNQAQTLNTDSLQYALRLNFDPRMQSDRLSQSNLNTGNNQLTVIAHFGRIKNIDLKQFEVKNILQKDLSAFTETDILILIEKLYRSQYDFGSKVSKSRYKDNPIALYALVFHHLKKMNYFLYEKILSIAPGVITFKNLGLNVPDLIKQIDLLDKSAN